MSTQGIEWRKFDPAVDAITTSLGTDTEGNVYTAYGTPDSKTVEVVGPDGCIGGGSTAEEALASLREVQALRAAKAPKVRARMTHTKMMAEIIKLVMAMPDELAPSFEALLLAYAAFQNAKHAYYAAPNGRPTTTIERG